MGLIDSACFDGTLDYQGVATSSHGDDPVKFLYTNLTLNGSAILGADLLERTIGEVRSGDAFNGIFP